MSEAEETTVEKILTWFVRIDLFFGWMGGILAVMMVFACLHGNYELLFQVLFWFWIFFLGAILILIISVILVWIDKKMETGD